MDWELAMERNHEALRRVLAALFAMARIAMSPHPEVRAEGEPRRTLPRHLHRAVLRLLRPAEAATRRLIVVVARGLVVTLPPPRPRKVRPKPLAPVLRSLGIAVVIPRDAAGRRVAGPYPEALSPKSEPRRAAGRARAISAIALPLVDPLRRPRPGRPRYVPAHAAPRIISFDGAAPHRLPPPPSPGDPIDATRLDLRLRALAAVLDDLPAHAHRFARWHALRDRADPPLRSGGGGPRIGGGGIRGDADELTSDGGEGPRSGGGGVDRDRFRRLSPLKPGRAPGSPRRPTHEVHEILADMQYFARAALENADTS